MSVHIQSQGLDEMIDSFERLGRDAAAEAAAERMTEHIEAGFAETQAALAPHLKTGRTAASGTVESSYRDGIWRGRVSYGIEGPEGEHLTGAVWLLVQQRGDYLAPLGHTGEQIGAELDSYFDELR